jgi:hypothetical protein
VVCPLFPENRGLSPIFAEALRRPLSIVQVHDGGVYSLNLGRLPQTGLFFNVGRIDDVFIKMPSRRGLADYFACVRYARPTSTGIRPLEDRERFERLGSTLEPLPEFGQLAASRPELVHYLVLHKLQYERLRAETAVAIPAAKFALLRTRLPREQLEPVVFQEPIEGTTLWDMFDFAQHELTHRWRPSLPAISAQLSQLVASSLSIHVDWNIRNFVFRETDQRLFYVDLKPTLFAAVETNDGNLDAIRKYFID